MNKDAWDIVSQHLEMEDWRKKMADNGDYKGALFGVESRGRKDNDPEFEKEITDRQIKIFEIYDKYK